MKRWRIPAFTLSVTVAFSLTASVDAATLKATGSPVNVAQAMIPPTGVGDAETAMPADERYKKRFPQPARVGDLIGLPVLNMNASTIGFVQHVVRTSQNKVKLIVSYSRWWGRFGRPVAVPLEVVGIEGRELVSLDMAPAEYASAATWQAKDDTVLPDDASIRIALARN